MGPQYYTRSAKLTGLEHIAKGCDADLVSQLHRVGLDPSVLKRSDVRIAHEETCQLLQNCARDWGIPDLGLRMIHFQKIDFLGPVALVTRMAKTVRQAVEAIIANLPIYSNVTLAALEEKGGIATITLNQLDSFQETPENALLVLAQGKMTLDAIAIQDVRLIQVELRQSQGPSAAAITAHFGCPVQYNALRNSFSFDVKLLNRKRDTSDTAYHDLIERYLFDTRNENTLDVTENVRRVIAKQMEFGSCTLMSVATALQTEPHTLQRRLRSHGVSFRQLVEDWRKKRALSLVTKTHLPLSEVSMALGYSDQSIFSQAFRRWYGVAPMRRRRGE